MNDEVREIKKPIYFQFCGICATKTPLISQDKGSYLSDFKCSVTALMCPRREPHTNDPCGEKFFSCPQCIQCFQMDSKDCADRNPRDI